MVIGRLPRVLLAAAGAASLAYAAFRARQPATLTRTCSLESLAGDLAGWLPKLPYLPYIRIELSVSGDFLQITGDGETVDVDLPQVTARQRGLAPTFRQACADAGVETLEVRGSDGGRRLRCALPAEPRMVARVLERLLIALYDAGPATELLAAVPSRG